MEILVASHFEIKQSALHRTSTGEPMELGELKCDQWERARVFLRRDVLEHEREEWDVERAEAGIERSSGKSEPAIEPMKITGRKNARGKICNAPSAYLQAKLAQPWRACRSTQWSGECLRTAAHPWSWRS